MQKPNVLLKFTRILFSMLLIVSFLLPYTALAEQQHSSQVDEAEQRKDLQKVKQSLVNERALEQKSAIAEQLDVLQGEPRLHEQLQKRTGPEEVAIIIHLSERAVGLEKGLRKLQGNELSSTEEATIKQKIQSQQTLTKKEMQVRGIQFQEGFSFQTVLNGLSGTVRADDLPKLVDIKGVQYVEPDTEMYALGEIEKKAFPNKPLPKSDPNAAQLKKKAPQQPLDAQMDESIQFLGIEKLWKKGLEGQGISVAVLDTGIDPNHPDFAGIYKGGKNFVPHTDGRYARPREANDASETSPLDRPPHLPEFNDRGSSFYTSHGTHVAGTIAATGNNPYGLKGIAPKVDLYAYRVLGAYGSGATSGIIKAIDTAVVEKMDIINLSLGGGRNTETDASSFAINNAMMAGTIAVVATGNAGPRRGTIGTPSTSRLGIAVGNSTKPEIVHRSQVHITSGNFTLTKPMGLMATTFGQQPADQLVGNFELVAVPGIGAKKDYEGLDVTGKVVLVKRGDIAFSDKIEIAKEQGAVAILIHNTTGGSNAPGSSDVYIGNEWSYIPTYDVSQTDGEAIRKAFKQTAGTIRFDQFDTTVRGGDELANSSSRGPTTPNFDIKPDVVAPGTDILSTIPKYQADFPEVTYEEAYARKSGTSMATPHVAGVAALVKQANPNWSPFDVKVALSNTAKLLDTNRYDVFAQGAGRVQPFEAAHPKILAYAIDTAQQEGAMLENIKGTITFGQQPLDKDVSLKKQLIVRNMKDGAGKYEATVEVTKPFGNATVSIDQPTFTLSDEQVLQVTLKAPQASTTREGEMLGYIHLTGNGTNLSLPFAVSFSNQSSVQIKDMTISSTDINFNGDGVKNEALLTFTTTGDVRTNFIEVWDMLDPEGGKYQDGYIGYLHASQSLAAGSYELAVRGKYSPWTGEPVTTIPDGLYTIDFTAETVSGDPPVISDYVGPIVVKSTAGTIDGTLTAFTVKGQIDDAYIGYQQELEKYNLGYDVNTKLKATYEVVEEGTVVTKDTISLQQDGTFSFDLPKTFNAGTQSVIVKYQDAAGNATEKQIHKAGAVSPFTYKLNYESLSLAVGTTETLRLTELKTLPDGTITEQDVTADASFVSADETIASVSNGQVIGRGVGQTTIHVQYGAFEQQIPVTVTSSQATVTRYEVNHPNLQLLVGEQKQLIVTETTTKPNGEVIKKDVTGAVRYRVVQNSIATVHKGVVTAKASGKTQVRLQLPSKETYYVYLEVVDRAQDQVSYTVNHPRVTLSIGQQKQLLVTERRIKPNGEVIERDVTGQLRYSVMNNQIATVQKGIITAKDVGKTQVRIKLPNDEWLFVYINVEQRGQNSVTYSVNETNVNLEVGDAQQIIVTEKTTTPDGTTTLKDVTVASKFHVVDQTVATVHRGLVKAVQAGKTQVRVTTPDQQQQFIYVQVNDTPKASTTYELQKTHVTLQEQDEYQLQVEAVTTHPNGVIERTDATGDSRFTSENRKIATVRNGLITARQGGQTQIQVTFPDGTSRFVYVQVVRTEKTEEPASQMEQSILPI